MNRRQLFSGIGVLLVGLQLPESESSAIELDLAAAVASNPAALALGRQFLEQRPTERCRARLRELLTRAMCLHDSVPRTANRLDRFRAVVTRDFEHGRLVTLDGFVLAESEGRLLALAALQAGS